MASKNCVGSTSITDIHQEIIETHILTRLNGPNLVSTALASPLLHAVCMNEKVWSDICNSTWNSTKHPRVRDTISAFPSGHRSFFSDSFPVLHHRDCRNSSHRGNCSAAVPQAFELISAVDIHYKNKLVYSKVDITNTGKDAFLDSTFRVELISEKESVKMPVKYEVEDDVYFSDLKEYMTLSWIVIDPTQKRAANVSSLTPVTVRPHWVDGDIEVKYAKMVAGDCQAGMLELVELRIVVKLGWKEGGELELRKVNLQVQDIDGNCLSGKDSLGILQEAIQNGKRKKGKKGEERERHRKYVYMKRERREEKSRRRRRRRSALFPTAATIFPALILLFFLAFYFIRVR